MPVWPTTPEEQAAIVRFLDHADEQIQRYIASKERLIALLEEERQALVHQAVTRGLDPNVRLKPSGVEWLGDVPEHWEDCPRFARQVKHRRRASRSKNRTVSINADDRSKSRSSQGQAELLSTQRQLPSREQLAVSTFAGPVMSSTVRFARHSQKYQWHQLTAYVALTCTPHVLAIRSKVIT